MARTLYIDPFGGAAGDMRLGRAELPGRVRERALAAFRRPFEAEAEVHGVALE